MGYNCFIKYNLIFFQRATPRGQGGRVLVQAMGHDPALLRASNEFRARTNSDDNETSDITFTYPTKRKLSEELDRALSEAEEDVVIVEVTDTQRSQEAANTQPPKRRHFDHLVSTIKYLLTTVITGNVLFK
jgi:hypothetical protein